MKRYSILGAIVLSGTALLLGAGSAQAQLATAKCTAGKIKCASGKTAGLLGCHNKAETKNVALDPACVSKVELKYSTPVKGCMEKLEAKAIKDPVKSPCATTGDAGSLEAKVDAFVLDVVTELDPAYPAPVLNKCSAGKKKCVSSKAAAILNCYGKDATKPNPAALLACIQKAQNKYSGGLVPSKGCFAKLEAKPGCLTMGDSGALESKVDAFALDVKTELTGAPVAPTLLDFSTGVAGGTCGNTKDGSNVLIKNLTCGGLSIGAGGSIIPEGPTPDGSISRFSLSCVGSNCTIGSTSVAPAVNTGTPDCTTNGCNFGTPLPIPNPIIVSLSTCVLNTWNAAASGTLDLATGASSTNVPLISDTYLTGNLAQPCPRCSATGTPASPGHGTCDRGPRTGMVCATTSSTGYTRDCPTGGSSGATNCGPAMDQPCTCAPGGGFCLDGSHVGPINVNLSPLTTGTASKTDPAGNFCPGQINTGGHFFGCFGSHNCRTITETGTPAGPITNGSPASATLASVFCIGATGNGLVDASADLPGPGAVSLPGGYLAHN